MKKDYAELKQIYDLVAVDKPPEDGSSEHIMQKVEERKERMKLKDNKKQVEKVKYDHFIRQRRVSD